MNDWYNDPPDYDEAPDWYISLEDVLECMSPPQEIADAIAKLLKDWSEAQNQQYDPNF